MTEWHTRIEFTTPQPFSDDAASDALDHLAKDPAGLGPVGHGWPERGTYGFTLTTEAPTAPEATIEGARLVLDALNAAGIHGAQIVEAMAQTYERLDEELAKPTYPPVVGYKEIAEAAGVTRARAQQFAKYPTFPLPVIVTAQGPLYDRAAALSWVETRPTQRGRRKKAA